SATFPRFRKLYEAMRIGIENGKSFGTIFQEYKHSKKAIPSHIQHMIAAAEKSGLLEKTLKKISKVYEEKIDILTKNLTVLMEPLMLVIVWAGVVILALAVITPIYGLIGNLSSVGKNAPAPTTAPKDSAAQEEQKNKVKKLQVMKFPNEKINIMSQRSFYSDVLMEAEPKQIFEYVIEKEGWYKVKLEGVDPPEGGRELPEYGWIQRKYIILLS
ncbi:hypothetical protein GF362_00270, partial [Candidatus Dojkabacteria bacterium]|nr:hypothetical protein [Candidatus Dojkabacteria bacterium]